MNQLHPNLPAPGDNPGDRFEIGSFDFHGDPVTILSNHAGNWAVLGQLCQNLTLDPNGQRQMIERKSWALGKTCVSHVMLPGQVRAYPQFLIHERIVPMWLANITTSRIADEAVRRNIELAQTELADALYEYVTRHGVTREPTKLELARDLVAMLEAKEALETANKALAPKADKWERFVNSDGLIAMNAAAKALREITGGLGRTKFMDLLRSDRIHFLQKQNPRIPYEEHVKKGRAEVKLVEAGYRWTEQTFFTSKGLDWLADRLSTDVTPAA
ncbi:phage antirepressor KilAC domain-containing protein [Streptomyces sp. NPDC045456]|uniref:phage antirepressor KilAC domain-containing protein n=1 Tax=Streptomyces sp. NPDC045456 TaxID=3155254 RepID=UPI0033C4E9B5